MRITLGDNSKQAMRILDIESYPFTSKILAENFKKMIKIHHPDKGGTEQKAKEIISSYTHLKHVAIAVSIDDKIKAEKDIEKHKGMFDFVKPCPRCKGTGKSSWFDNMLCGTCEGTGKVRYEPFNPVITKGSILT